MNNIYNEVKENLKNEPSKWLITGAAGFIGSNLVQALLELNQIVIGVDNFITGKKENLENIKDTIDKKKWSNFTFTEGDVRDLDFCQSIVDGVDYILHQAALGSVPRSIKDPLLSHEHNVNGQLNMLIAASKANVSKFVFASSSSVYGDSPTLPKQEDELGSALSPYAVTKKINEIYAEIFNRTYNLNYIGIRYFNVFGKRQDPKSVYSALIPLWSNAFINNKDVHIFGDGETSRDFCYIENVIQLNILAATNKSQKASNQIYNCACAERTTLNKLFEIIKAGLLPKFQHIKNIMPTYQDFREGDITHSLADISKAETLLGYKPTHDIKQGIEQTLNWYIQNLEKAK